jgi:hypothetical protein
MMRSIPLRAAESRWFAEHASRKLCERNRQRVLARAAAAGRRVWIGMEGIRLDRPHARSVPRGSSSVSAYGFVPPGIPASVRAHAPGRAGFGAEEKSR